jgi:glucose/arabinose dehydrogenase
MNMRHFVVGALLCAIAVPAFAQFALTDAFPSLPAFSSPIECVTSGDGTGRLFVAEQRGRIWVFNATASSPQRRLFLDLTSVVSQSGNETGLLGLAFHPQYASNGQFFVDYTSSSSGSLKSYIARYTVSATDPDSAVKSSGAVLLTVDQPFDNHNGGKIAFGPDGYLYIALGDGGDGNDPGNNGQTLTTALGKILRIDVNTVSPPLAYGIPPSNPFATNALGYRKEIYAYGLRNPWRFSFDAVDGTLWAGDVGQGTREEVDTIIAGGNYGWRLTEGFICTPGVNPTCKDTAGTIKPLWDYPHASGDISITGGYVYRGSAIPSLRGKYIYGDYGSGRIWALTLNGSQPATNALLLDSPLLISAFAQDREREVYVVSIGTGRLMKLTGPATDTGSAELPRDFYLAANFPNPFNPSTVIRFGIPFTSRVMLSVFDVLGREVRILAHDVHPQGSYEVRFDATGLPSGVYLYRLQAGAYSETRKLVLLR